jgi:histidinol-phosphate aminotransferase
MKIKPLPHIEQLVPYSTTAQDPWLSTSREQILKMDWNEGKASLDFLKPILNELFNQTETLNWYPDCNCTELTQVLCQHLGCSHLNLLIFPGSDVALESLCRVFLSIKDKVLMLTPSYDNFRVYALSCGAQVDEYHIEKPFQLNTTPLHQVLNKAFYRMLYITSPNNPCGYQLSHEDLTELCERNPHTIIVVDEAYIEFSSRGSCFPLIDRFENLVVVRTFSKAYSLAGIRLGYLMAHHQVCDWLARIRNGKNVTMLAQQLAKACLENHYVFEDYIREVMTAREWLGTKFKENSITYYPSQGNFILFEVDDPKWVCAELKRLGIYIRDRSWQIDNALRVSITSFEDVKEFWKSLQTIL